MYKVIIIDDESLIRQGLRSIVDWDGNGFEIVGEADDGISGVSLVLEEKPDLILVDIRMPGQSGLDLIDEVRNKGYDGKVIILTGYSEFEYAKAAISLSVTSYLLKPIDEDELEELLVEIKAELDQKLAQTNTIENSGISKRIELAQKIIFDSQLSSDDLIALDLDQYLDEKSGYFATILFRNEEETFEVFKQFFTGKVRPLIITMPDYFILLFKNNTKRQLSVILRELSKQYLKCSNQECFIAVGSHVKGYRELATTYKDAISIYKRRFLFRNQPIVFWENFISSEKDIKDSFIDSKYLYGLIEVGNSEAMDVYFTKLEDDLTCSELTSEKIKGICIKGYIEVREWFVYNYKNLADQMPENVDVIDKIYEASYLADIISYLQEIFTHISLLICDGSSDNTMMRLLNYIHNNYNKNLKLEGLARLFNYNSSYLGKIFKENTGFSFNNYLDKIRIEHAKELLKTESIKVYEIAEIIGYGNVDYFYSKFKKHVGMSPKAYKKEQC